MEMTERPGIALRVAFAIDCFVYCSELKRTGSLAELQDRNGVHPQGTFQRGHPTSVGGARTSV